MSLLLAGGRVVLAACFVWALRVAYKTIKADADSFRSTHPGLVGTAAKEGLFVSLGVNLLWVVTDEGAHLGVLRASAVALALVYFSVRLFFAALPTIAKRYRTTGVFDIRVLTAVATVVLAFSMIYQQGGLREGNAAAGGGTFVYFSVVTLTTLGYGDVLPTEPMRFFACAEALVGYVLLGGIASLLFQIADSERTGGAGAPPSAVPAGPAGRHGLVTIHGQPLPTAFGLIPPAWLDHALDATELARVPAAFLARQLPGDEVWLFASPPESWQAHAGRLGYALVRAGQVVDVIVTLQN